MFIKYQIYKKFIKQENVLIFVFISAKQEDNI